MARRLSGRAPSPRIASALPLSILVTANLVPLLGVLFLDWAVFEVVLVYWFESLILGVRAVLGAIIAGPGPPRIEGLARLGRELKARVGAPLLLLALFGFMCAFFGVFVVWLAGDGFELPIEEQPGSWVETFGWTAVVWGLFVYLLSSELRWPALALALRHLEAFLREHFGETPSGAPERHAAGFLGRIIVLHLAICFGAGFSDTVGNPLALLTLLVLGKTALEVFFHLDGQREPRQG